MATKLSLIAGVVHSLLTLFYLLAGFRLSSLYTEVNIDRPHPILSNWPLIVFAIFAVLDFLNFWYLKNKAKQQIKPKYGWMISLLLLIAPFLIFFLVGLYANIQVSKVINESY